MATLTEQLSIKLKDLFVNRADAYARQSLTKDKKKMFVCVKEPINEGLILNHLLEQDFLGVYQLSKDNKVKWGVCDFDADSEEDFENCFKLLTLAKEKGFNPLPELSGGGKNNLKVHLWFFPKEPIPAEQMRNFLEYLCKEAKVMPHEIFPKQVTLDKEGFGNLVKLPLGKHLETKRLSFFLDDKREKVIEAEKVLEKVEHHLANKDNIPIITKEIVEYQKPVVSLSASEFDKFFNYCIYNELPVGKSVENKKYQKITGVNDNVLKNEAIWFFKKGYTLEQLEQEIKPIFEERGWAFSDLKGWYKKVQNPTENFKGTDINSGELAEWCKTYSPELLNLLPSNRQDGFRLSPYSDGDLEGYVPEPQSWLIENQIPKGEIGLLVGKRGEKKTWTAVRQAIGLAAGIETFGDKVPERKRVLIIDEESGKNTIALRRNLLKNGVNIKEPLEIKFLSFEGLKLDRLDSEKFKQFRCFLDEFKPDLVIVDCLARVVSFEIDKDNAAINELFTAVIRPLIKTTGMTWLFLHHLRKSPQGNIKVDDNLDEVRGGSELVNYCRFVLMCQTPKYQTKSEDGSEMMVFKVLKMSNSEMPEPKVISFVPDKPNGEATSIKMDYIGKCEDVLATEVRVGNAILEYLFANQITGEFKTKDIESAAEQIGFKRSFLSVGLKSLVERSKINKIRRGTYEVSSETKRINAQQKLIEEPKSSRGFTPEELKQAGLTEEDFEEAMEDLEE